MQVDHLQELTSSHEEQQGFQHLPKELRLKIWNYCEPRPRTVVVFCKDDIIIPKRRWRGVLKAYRISTMPPAVLHICRESRAEILPRYNTFFRGLSSRIYTYIRPECDTVSISDSSFTYLKEEELASLHSLEIQVHHCLSFIHDHLETIVHMKSLKNLKLTIHERDPPENLMYAWTEATYVGRLEAVFRREKEGNPGWEAPNIHLRSAHSARVVGRNSRYIEGGALVPGWKFGDALPLDEDFDL